MAAVKQELLHNLSLYKRIISRPCQHVDGQTEGRSQIKDHTDERTQVHSAQSSLMVTHRSTNRGRRFICTNLKVDYLKCQGERKLDVNALILATYSRKYSVVCVEKTTDVLYCRSMDRYLISYRPIAFVNARWVAFENSIRSSPITADRL